MTDRLLSSRYRLGHEIGRGGMSTVWEATDELLGRQVAVKILELGEVAGPEATNRFLREAQIAASINHSNIVTVFDTGVDGSTAFIVMELLAGPTLAHQIAESGPLPVSEVLTVAGQVCAALASAHAAGVVHRDIKPSNIAYASDGHVKVLDFGIARLLEAATGQTELTRTATIMGTAAYLSPEQARGDPVSARTDLYALGCVIFAMVVGHPPFRGGTAVEVCSQHLHVEAPRLAGLVPSVPSALDALVSELLQKDPAARPQDASTVRRRLVSMVNVPLEESPTVPLGAPEELTATREYALPITAPGEPGPRRRLVAALVGVVLAAAVGVTIALLASGSAPQRGATRTTATTSTSSSTSTSTPASSTTTSSTTTSSTTTTIPKVTTPAQAITRLQAAIAKTESNGQLTAPAATELSNRLTVLSKTIATGNEKNIARKVAGLVSNIQDLARSGALTPAGHAALAEPLAVLERLLPPQNQQHGGT